MADDPLISGTEEEGRRGGGGRAMQAANLFDLRRIIGGLFVLYGFGLTLLGLLQSDAERHRAAGVNINLWAGLGMLALGILFLVWAMSRPLGEELREAQEGEPGGPTHPPPRGVDAAALASHQRRRRPGGDPPRTGGEGDPRP
jgi:hypothetical protein